jgi:hypothetical protein
MVELIFALVIMGIALMSAPMLISVSTKSVEVSLQQEGLNEASSRVNMLLTYPWDENDINDSCIPPVLTVSNGDSQLDMVVSTARRVGVPLSTNSHTFKCGDQILPATLAVDGKNDIDDFIGTTILNAPGGGAGGVDYIEQTTVTLTTSVVYGNDTAEYDSTSISFTPSPGVASTNIKNITVVLTSSSTVQELKDKQITFSAFSCNIGGIEYISKEI